MRKLIKSFSIFTIGIFFIQLPSHAEWIKIAENQIGIEYYFDPEYTSKKENLVIFQVLANHKEKTPGGNLSSYLYMKGDCEKFSIKWDKGLFSKKSYDFQLNWFLEEPQLLYVKNPEWKYPAYDSPWGKALKKTCELKF